MKQQQIRRLKRNLSQMDKTIKTLKEQKLIPEHMEKRLRDRFSGVSSEIFERMTKFKKSGRGKKCSPELKSFALTLQFYSTKAYKFVRKTLNYVLPHSDVISKWCSKIPSGARLHWTCFQGSVTEN